MKSFNVDRNMKDKDIIRLAITKVCKNKKKRKGRPTTKYLLARRILANIDDYIELTYKIVCDTESKQKAVHFGTYIEGSYPLAFVPKISGTFKRRCDNGKIRDITSVPLFPDQIIHQLVIMAAEKVFMRGMYSYSCGSVPKRGVHKGKRYIQKYISQHKNKSAIKYTAQLDIKKCYQNIQHDVLKSMLRKKFRGHLFITFCFSIIDSYSEPGKPGIGIPIGFYTSQWFCNFLLTPIDNFIKQELKIECFMRYVDDMAFFGSNKKKLHRAVEAIIARAEEIGLHIKDNWQVFRFDYISKKDGKHKGRALDVLGFRFFRDKVILRKRNALSIRRAALRLSNSKHITPHAAQSFMSKIGALRHCNSRRFWEKYVKPYVNIKQLKEVIRYESRKHIETEGV